MYVCISKLSYHWLSLSRHYLDQCWLIWALRNTFQCNSLKCNDFHPSKKMHSKVSSAKWWSFFLVLRMSNAVETSHHRHYHSFGMRFVLLISFVVPSCVSQQKIVCLPINAIYRWQLSYWRMCQLVKFRRINVRSFYPPLLRHCVWLC